ncbi:sugar ABC transporter substrate-binding protein [Leptolyngbya sp. FACHB-541]|uniref:ABC transporter substrate-binding protein n=1 Tax=Leptolyngbya sp. FACHB-541 TaxID=2692810 RepID=UPI00168565E1|nr:sugar ABC transporter substrate-binding protein [Leptolyngbya sp. FACHB-541]MBD1995889.1 sugar ABC transporter substrate-binding protein [Leptolyngbya sp. FACHB-541]
MGRISKWKRLGIFALLGLLLSWMVSCSAGPPNSEAESGTQEVEFWTMQLQPEFTDYFNQLIATFESENPETKVRWVDVPWADMQSKILTAVSAGTAPDVVNLNPDFAAQLAGLNAWLDLGDKISPEQQQQYLPKIWEAGTLDGKSFGIPWYLTTSVTIYNQQLLEQAGIPLPAAEDTEWEQVSTYENLAEVARAVNDETGKYAFFVTFVPEDSAEVLQSFAQMGVQLVDEEGQAAFNTPEGRAAFQYWVDLYKDGLLPREVLTQGHRRAIELYQSGEVALLSSSPHFLETVATNAPAIAQVSGVAPQITGSTGAKSVAVMNLVIPQSTDQPDAAVKFALFVTNNENQLAFAKAANVLPSTVEALKDGYFTALPAEVTPPDRARVVSASQMEDAQVLLPQIKDVKKLQGIIYDNLQAAMLDQKTVEQAIADAESEWNNR